MKRSAFLIAALLAGGCASSSPWLLKVPYLSHFYKKPYLPYAADRFSFERPRRWESAPTEHGAEVKDPGGKASFSVEFIAKDDPAYKPPELYRQYMAGWGSTEDRHIAYDVQVSSHPAWQVVFTSYEYDARYLTGEQVEVSMSEVTLVPDPEGNFILRYRAPRDDFYDERYRAAYRRFLDTLVLKTKSDED